MTEQYQDVQAELNDQLLVRREKMAQMAEAGVNPFAAGFSRDLRRKENPGSCGRPYGLQTW